MTAASAATTRPRPAIRLEVRGHGGLLAGVERTLAPGQTLAIGRSRTCDLSLRTTPAFQRRRDADRLLESRQFNRVSRVHCEIEFRKDGQVQIRDLSQNGTIVDGVKVGRTHLVRLGSRPISVELVDGTWGKLLLAMSAPPR